MSVIIQDNIILKTLAKDCSINFIASVISPWHAISLVASLNYMQQSLGIQMNGIVRVVKHPQTGYAIKENELQFANVKYICFTDNYFLPQFQTTSIGLSKWKIFIQHRKQNYRLLKYVLLEGFNWRRKRPLYVLSPWNVNFSMGMVLVTEHYFVKYVILDEGIGNYIGNGLTKQVVKPFISLRQRKTYFIHNIIPIIWLPKFHHVINACAFEKKKKGRCVLKQFLRPYYQQAIIKHSISGKTSFPVDGKVIICTSVLYDTIFQNSEDIIVWRDLCKVLYAAGIQLVLKPHPRDTFFASFAEEWHCELIDGHCTIEDICACSKPIAIVGHHSTALVTANAFFSIPAICVTDLFNPQNVSKEFMDGAEKYKYVFFDMVQFPETYEDCLRMILMAKNK